MPAVDYDKSLIVAKTGENANSVAAGNQALAPEIKLGMRLPSVKVVSQSDARPWHLQELLPSNGTWRLILFPGDVSKPEQQKKLHALTDQLGSSSSFLKRFTPKTAQYDSVIEVLTVHGAKRENVELFSFPEVLRPYDEVLGWDYNKIFVDDESYHEGYGNLYETFGIDRSVGCAIVVRPDQYVSYVGKIDDYASIDSFFSCFLKVQN